MKIEDFKKDWKSVHGKTLEFLMSLPEDKMAWRPHKELGTFGMQIRHMIKTEEAYVAGMKNGKIDFSDKKFDPEWEINKQQSLMKLNEVDQELITFLDTADQNKEITFVDGVFGEKKISLSTALDYLMNHESYHQGVFTCYGRLAGLGKFIFM